MKISPFSPLRETIFSALESIKEYHTSKGILKILFDPIKGAAGSIEENNRTIEVPFRCMNIPKVMQFNKLLLSKYLADTYPRIQGSSDNNYSIEIFARINGGGNGGSSSYTQSQHNRSAPPPNSTAVNYSAGFPIRTISYTAPSGTFIDKSGGEGDTHFSVKLQCSDYQVRPKVVIGVWRKDYHAKEIQRLESCRVSLLESKKSELLELSNLEKAKQQILLTLQNLQNHSSTLKGIETEHKTLLDEVSIATKSVEDLEINIQSTLLELKKESQNIQGLIDLIGVMQRLGFDGLLKGPSLEQFLSNEQPLKVLLGSQSTQNSVFFTTTTSLNLMINSSTKAQNKEIVALVGNTGVGKSTIVNHLLGVGTCYVPSSRGGTIQVVEGEKEIAKIGHSKSQSETLYSQVYERQGVPFSFADCGGFFDTRGADSDLAVITSLKMILESAKSVKLMLCFDSNLISNDRGIHFRQSLELILKTLLKDYRDQKDALLVLFTKPTLDLQGHLFASQDAKDLLTDLMGDFSEGSEEKSLYEFLLRDGGRYITVYDPLSSQSRDEAYRILAEMKPIPVPKQAFQIPVSAETQVALFEEMVKTATKTNTLYKMHVECTERLKEASAKVLTLDAKLKNLEGNQTSLKDFIEGAEAFLKVNKMAGVELHLATIKANIEKIQLEEENYVYQIRDKDTEGIVTYQSDGGEWKITGD